MGILNLVRFSIKSSVTAVSLLTAIVALPSPLLGESYLPGPEPVCYMLHLTAESIPGFPDRTKVGICERVSCSIVGWQDTDIRVDDEGNQSPIQDGNEPRRVDWYVEGNGTVFPSVGKTVTYRAGQNSNDTMESLFATVQDSGTKGLDGPVIKQVVFAVRVPKGAKALLLADLPIGMQGPPNNNLGAMSEFVLVVLPDDVNFSNANIRENIPEQRFTWPDGTNYVRTPYIKAVRLENAVLNGVPQPNVAGDGITSGMDPATRLNNGQGNQSCTFNVQVPLEFEFNGGGFWLFFANQVHPREYSGANLKCRVGKQCSGGSAYGGWQGPWQ